MTITDNKDQQTTLQKVWGTFDSSSPFLDLHIEGFLHNKATVYRLPYNNFTNLLVEFKMDMTMGPGRFGGVLRIFTLAFDRLFKVR